MLGDIFAAAGDTEGAVKVWREAVEILEAPGDPEAHAVRERLAAHQGKP
jgi:predicted negative regulator of RcsB-dependent stress response